MFASSRGPHPAARRRGIVLVLVLGMLGLMALIGVTFAAFAGQSLKNSRNYGQGAARPQPEALMDFALAQLINDSNNPLSALRGHSLLRDMYGNDSVYRGVNPAKNAVVDLLVGGVFDRVYNGNYGVFQSLQFTPGKQQLHPYGGSNPTPFYGQYQYQTNIPIGGQYYGLDFTRWTLRFAHGTAVAQTFEVLEDVADSTSGYHLFTLGANLGALATDPTNGNPLTYPSGDLRSFIYVNPNLGVNTSNNPPKAFSSLATEGNTFVLDGRYMRAFNGPGRTRPVAAASSFDINGNVVTQFANYPYNLAAYGNMRLAEQYGFVGPDVLGMDEDYDACDLENWFLAIQSADGQVMIPSFHRPGILTATDWTDPAYDKNGNALNQVTRAKILRPRQVDNSPLFPGDPSVPDSTTRKLTYDIDNDGDGVTDSVWLDLGYPTQRDVNGKLSKPLFAFMVLGLNGRLPLNTVGNLQARAIGDTTNNTTDYSTPYPTSSGQVPYSGFYTTSGNHHPGYTSQVFFDTPLYDHASHLGFSANEINPKFALQNAPANLYGSSAIGDLNGPYSQIDNAGVSVALTQLRNLLAGGMATDLTNPSPLALDGSNSMGTTVQNLAGRSANSFNDDINYVTVKGSNYIFPNGMADAYDYDRTNNTIHTNVAQVSRAMPAIPGRWGEPEGQPRILYIPSSFNDADTSYPMLRYHNPVRAGRSYYTATGNTNDPMDDDFDSFDPYLPTFFDSAANNTFEVVQDTSHYDGSLAHQYELPVNSIDPMFVPETFARKYPEDIDRFDGAGQAAVATERIRRYVTPHDPGGVGRMTAFMNRPAGDFDYGKGADKLGRVGFFRYFRPAGMPQAVVYPYSDTSLTGFGAVYAGVPYRTTSAAANASGLGQRYLAPVLIPAGRTKGMTGTLAVPLAITPDVTNNPLHGYQAMATPDTQGGNTGDPSAHLIATMGAMPFDWVASTAGDGTGSTPAGYPNTLALYSPTIDPNYPVLSHVNSITGPNLGAVGAGGTDTDGKTYPIPYVPNGSYGSYGASPNPPYDPTAHFPNKSMVVNGYIGGSLNKDEADEMNLYVANGHDMPYGPTDLEWLYRKHDVDGATLDSRLGQLAPISFLNPDDGLTRRRLFSTDAWDLTSFAYANDNPVPYAGVMGFDASQSAHPPYSGIHTSDHEFTYNSRFGSYASPSFETMNQVVDPGTTLTHFASSYTTEFLFNPTLPVHTYSSQAGGNGDSFTSFVPNSNYILGGANTPTAMPYPLGANATPTAVANPYNNLIDPSNIHYSTMQVQTPTVAHRDRKINLNFPLPISADPAEPVRQKWCRETYQLLKSILPPAAVDTPEELAQLSQFVVNIVDFRDPDCTMTRFVNTDLVITDALTKTSSPVPPTTGWTGGVGASYPPVMDVSPMGVRFTNGLSGDKLLAGHFPYDASLYNPDQVTPFLVQHGMEFNPIAINEAFAVQYQYAVPPATTMSACRGLFIELTNTLTEAQNDSRDGNTSRPSQGNSSAVDLTGWDMIITPDEWGWGRPDPITGDVSVVAWPPQLAGTVPTDPVNVGQKSANAALPNTSTTVQQYRFTSTAASGTNTGSNNKIRAINGSTVGDFGIVGGYSYTSAQQTTGAGQVTPPPSPTTTSTYVETNPVVAKTTVSINNAANPNPPTLDVVLPQSFMPFSSNVAAGSANGSYFWVYLRRPANPFDIDDLPLTGPEAGKRNNREMVVVDAMRFPYIDLGPATVTSNNGTITVTKAADTAFSAQRLQPYRGGHLVPKATTASHSVNVNGSVTATICPPTPAFAYGYSEQTLPSTGGVDYVQYDNNNQLASKAFQETIGFGNSSTGGSTSTADVDTYRALFPFHDRDFASVAELLLVPGCPPGLFTKQFVEEPYPGHAAGYSIANTGGGAGGGGGGTGTTTATDGKATAATGWDGSKLTGVTNPPSGVEVGQKDFGYNTLPAVPTFPYLTDNFYYTAASVAPPSTPNAGQTHLTTEIGGWTGAGWHKMLEFFEVPSSANGAIGTADAGNNYDWYRADLKPGQLNLNLIVDEEVFAGLIDDPRLNELLAYSAAGLGSGIPQIVTQINNYGHPTASASMFSTNSYNILANAGQTNPFGRGYAVRDPNSADYPAGGPYNYQQVHGLKAAFSDFLKLRHGGSGYLFAHGAGDISMGDAVNNPYPNQPIAADRMFRSLSYPDINYTILRPASLPPAPTDTSATPTYTGTNPPLPVALTTLFQYLPTGTAPSYVTLNPASYPFAAATPYIGDPGLRNPFLDTAFNNLTTAPPYDVSVYNVPTGYTANPATPAPAPFPPTIPPTPSRRLFQVPDTQNTNFPTSNAGLYGQQDNANGGTGHYMVNQPVTTPALSTGYNATPITPPTLVSSNRAVFAADNITPQAGTIVNNYLGAGSTGTGVTDDLRQHPAYRTEMLQKISNLTTVRTHQFATWITVGFFEVIKTGTPELGIPDVLGQEVGAAAGNEVRYRSFFVIDRTKATGFNPYYPGNFRDCVTYRRRIE